MPPGFDIQKARSNQPLLYAFLIYGSSVTAPEIILVIPYTP
jgi:hypothetical protein